MQLLVGLGNPGRKYAGTRHNIGFRVVDEIAARFDGKISSKKFQALFGKIKIDDIEVCVAKPQTFMNLSGYAVTEFVNYFRINVEDVLSVHDDIDMPLGKIKFVKKSGAGGHNGVSSIINEIGNSFYRLKVGIGRPEGEMEASDYVLAKVSDGEKPLYDQIVKVAADAVESFYKDGPEVAMQKFNNSLVPT